MGKSRCRKWMALPAGAHQSVPRCADEPGRSPSERPRYSRVGSPSPKPGLLREAGPAWPTFTAICSLCGMGLCLAYQATVPFEEHPFEEIAPVVTHSEGAIKHRVTHTPSRPAPKLLPRVFLSRDNLGFRISFCAFGPIRRLPLPAKPRSAVTFSPTHCSPENGCH